MNQIMFNYPRKRDRSGELSQSGQKVIFLWLGNFNICIGRRDVMTSLFYPVKIGCTSQKKIFLFKYFDRDCVFISNTEEDRVNRAFHNVVLIQEAPCSSLNLISRRKLRHDLIFNAPCLQFVNIVSIQGLKSA